MKSETLQLLAPLTNTTSTEVVSLLNAVKGVSEAIATGSSLNIRFDQDVTSTQELSTILQRAGFDVQKPVHGEDGVCCGSCS